MDNRCPIAATPPMGWNSWDCWGPAVEEAAVRENADFMARYLKPWGWEYIVVDIQWYEPTASIYSYHPFAPLCMDGYSRLIPAENRFPSSAGGKGFKPLADYVHSLGLKFGIHIMRGIPRQAVHAGTPILGTAVTARDIAKADSICHWNTDMYGVDPEKPGAKEYYDSIFALYASWDVDFIKCDDICRELPQEETELYLLSQSLRNCGRDMVLSLSPGPALPEKAEVYKETANMWRITDDFWDKWELLYDMFRRADTWAAHAGPGHWPDADMLPVGPLRQNESTDDRTRFTQDEQKTMLTLWSILRSPLMIGGNMPGFDAFTVKLLTNPGILEMHRTCRNARQTRRLRDASGEIAVWTADGMDGRCYIALFNLGETPQTLRPSAEPGFENGESAVELWSGEALLPEAAVTVPPHGVKVYKISESKEVLF